jgi:3',5'-cyclic AMP phosphodiesterase CpdA
LQTGGLPARDPLLDRAARDRRRLLWYIRCVRLLHVSDPHVQLRDWRTRPLRALGPLRTIATVELWKGRGRVFDGAEAALARWARSFGAYDHVLLTGDLSQLGLKEELQLARAALGTFAGDPQRLTLLPGNHDRYPWRGRAQRWFEEVFPEHQGGDSTFGPVRLLLRGEVALVVVDSSLPVSWPVWTQGAIGPAALEGTARALAAPEAAQRCKLVLTHHTPLRAGGAVKRPRHQLAGHAAFLRVCKQGGAQAVLAGHVHERFLVEPGPDRPLLVCCGSSTALGAEGGWELEVKGSVLQPPRLLAGPEGEKE